VRALRERFTSGRHTTAGPAQRSGRPNGPAGPTGRLRPARLPTTCDRADNSRTGAIAVRRPPRRTQRRGCSGWTPRSYGRGAVVGQRRQTAT
jgi:hypothetical protein